MIEFSDQACLQGDLLWPQWSGKVEETRKLAAELIHAAISDVGLIPNTTAGINLVAQGLDWKSGDNVVVPANEFPSNLLPWLTLENRGVEIRQVPPDPMGSHLDNQLGAITADTLRPYIDSKTRLISTSWVGYASSWRVDVASICQLAHDHNALYFLDAIQGLGIYPIDVQDIPVDFLAADGHKWLLGPEGAGIVYIRPDHLERLRPSTVGWNSVRNSHTFAAHTLDLKPSAARFEGGSANMIGMLGFRGSLTTLKKWCDSTPDGSLESAVLSIADELSERITAAGGRPRRAVQRNNQSGIVPFDWPGEDPAAVRQRLLKAGVVLSCRGGCLRAAPHAYNDTSDIDRLINALLQAETV